MKKKMSQKELDNLNPITSETAKALGAKGGRNGKPYTSVKSKFYKALGLTASQVKSFEGATLDDLRDMVKTIVLSESDIAKAKKIKKAPQLMQLIANAVKKGKEKGDFRYVNDILQIWVSEEDNKNPLIGDINITVTPPRGKSKYKEKESDG